MITHYLKYFLSFLLLRLSIKITAQSDHELGSWNGLGIKYEINQKFSFSLDSRLRAYSFYNNFYYYEGTFRLIYNVNNIFSISGGGGKHFNHLKTGNFVRPLERTEIRFYEEFTAVNSFSRFFFDHRIRADQRFITTGYENRFRYRIGSLTPLNNTEIISKTLILSLWDEIFISDYEPYLTMNRFFAGINYKLEYVTLQIGCVNQMSQNTSGKTFKNFFLTTFNFEIRHKEEK